MPEASKTLFITIPEPLIARNIFYTDFWPRFLERMRGWRVIVLTPPERATVYAHRLAHDNVEFVGVETKESGRWARILNTIALSSINTHTNLWERRRAFDRGTSSRIAFWLKSLHARTLGNIALYKHLLRWLLLTIAPHKNLVALFDAHKPDAVILSCCIDYDFDVPIGKEARRRKIRLLGMPRSWDNLTSHGLMRVAPDVLFVQNQYLRSMALKHQAIRARTTPIRVFGLPHYDLYKHAAEFVLPKDEFFARAGLDPKKRFVLYGAMGDFLFPSEGAIAPEIDHVIEEAGLGSSVQALFRAHPHFLSPLEGMKQLQHIKPDMVALRVDKDKPQQEFELEQHRWFISSLFWSDLVITSASTFAIDGVALGKPVICVAYDAGKPQPYWYSNARFYDTYTHFEALVATGGVSVARSTAELKENLTALLQDPRENAEGEAKLINTFVAPFDGKSGERLAAFMAEELQR